MLRGSGILLHISSLPGGFHCGDLGPAAFSFVDFLAQSGQKYWQVLPLSATNAGVGYSPYSCNSAFANNHLLISPEELFNKGYIGADQLPEKPGAGKSDFSQKEFIIADLIRKAFDGFDQQSEAFQEYCHINSFWLDDWALYKCLKKDFQRQSWNNWPEVYRYREQTVLREYASKNQESLQLEKFSQFIFELQWQQLKEYAGQKNIRLIGDVPIYLNYDSSDVWAYSQYFKINQAKECDVVAGVPPDYFSETGQLWGNPLYDWGNLQKDGFSWWVNRIKRNSEIFDMVRVDHFRGLVAYWQVSAQEKTAINGHWEQVPVYEFLDRVAAELGAVDLIAENLGVITDDVREVMEKYQLPGMKVLQFAFDGNNRNEFLPHMYEANNIVYTGTHDNNTTRGWFKYELNNEHKKQLSQYCGHKVYAENICETLISLALASVAEVAIIPMQDVLELDELNRMNQPGIPDGNWLWRFRDEQLTVQRAEKLYQLTRLFGRTDD